MGFMASGKSTVGKLLADRLGWPLVDVDAEIVSRFGAGIPELFETRGEAWFRRVEGEVVRSSVDLDGFVVVPGGGWASASRGLQALAEDVLSVWLQVSADSAVRRAAEQGPGRPLLDEADDPLQRSRDLLAERTPVYRSATLHLDTEGRSPVEVADQIIGYLT